jgi:putative transposase
MSEFYQSLSHSKWDCKYHVVFVPKYSVFQASEVR